MICAPKPSHQAVPILRSSGHNSCTAKQRHNPLLAARSELQRVYYRLEGDSLIRGQWASFDRVERTPQRERTVLEGGVRAISFQALAGQAYSDLDRAWCAWAEKLTLDPGAMAVADLDPLRDLGVDDVTISDAAQVVAYFNYINRIADAVHVDLEPEMRPYPD